MNTFTTLKARVYKFYEINKDKGKNYVAAHFLREGYAKLTVYRHIRDAESKKTLARKKGSGRKPTIDTPKNRANLNKMFNHKKKSSLRKA